MNYVKQVFDLCVIKLLLVFDWSRQKFASAIPKMTLFARLTLHEIWAEQKEGGARLLQSNQWF